jgi:hypothetical protein
MLGDMQEKASALGKLSTITKIIRGLPVRVKDSKLDVELVKNYRDKAVPNILSKHAFLPEDYLDSLSEYSSYDVAQTHCASGGYLTVPELYNLVLAKQLDCAPSEVPFSYGRAVAMLYPLILHILETRPDVVKVMLQNNEMRSNPDSIEKISEIVNTLPAGRLLTENALLTKAAASSAPRIGYMDAVRAWSQLFRMDSGGNTETVVIPMPDGRKLVAPRYEVLHAMVTAYDYPIPFDPLSASAFVLGGLDAAFMPRTTKSQNRMPISLGTLQRLPGLRGRIVNDISDLKPFTPGAVVKTAVDHCLSGGRTIVNIGVDVENDSIEEIYTKVGSAIQNLSEEILENV